MQDYTCQITHLNEAIRINPLNPEYYMYIIFI